jgi:hypothetical protein
MATLALKKQKENILDKRKPKTNTFARYSRTLIIINDEKYDYLMTYSHRNQKHRIKNSDGTWSKNRKERIKKTTYEIRKYRKESRSNLPTNSAGIGKIAAAIMIYWANKGRSDIIIRMMDQIFNGDRDYERFLPTENQNQFYTSVDLLLASNVYPHFVNGGSMSSK